MLLGDDIGAALAATCRPAIVDSWRHYGLSFWKSLYINPGKLLTTEPGFLDWKVTAKRYND